MSTGNDEKSLFALVNESWNAVNKLVGDALILDHQVPILEDVEDKLKHACRKIRDARADTAESRKRIDRATRLLHGEPI